MGDLIVIEKKNQGRSGGVQWEIKWFSEESCEISVWLFLVC
jgi:hypothetical protein